MIDTSETGGEPRRVPLGARPAHLAYALSATLFAGCIVLHVFLAGLGALVTFGDFDLHRAGVSSSPGSPS